MTNKGYLQLADLGQAAYPEHATNRCGTLEFQAPELIDPRRGAQSRAIDWWAFGILLYELFHGKTPFSTSTPSIYYTEKAILEKDVTFKSSLSEATKNLLNNLMQKEPGKRLCDSDLIKKHEYFQVFCFHNQHNLSQIFFLC